MRPFTGLCDEQVRKFLRVWCAPLGEADFVSQVGLRRVNRAVVVLVLMPRTPNLVVSTH